MPKQEKHGNVEEKWNRIYNRSTIALLYGLSGNRCANADCMNKIIEERTEFDDAAVIGHIAHIYSGSKEGPRSYADFDIDLRIINKFDNLILLCRHCHAIVDSQANTYTPEQVRLWKKRHLAINSSIKVSRLFDSLTHQSIIGLHLDFSQ